MRSTRHLVHPELEPFVDTLPTYDLSNEALPEIRRGVQEAYKVQAPLAPDGVCVSESWIPGRGGQPDVRILLYRPTSAVHPLPALLHVHGGGFVMGSAETMELRHRHFVREIGCIVVTVDYRLAPETPFPGPVEDCYTALLWLYRHAGQLGVDPARIAIGGESAGGGIAAALGLLTRDRGEVSIIFQWLIYPMLDDRTGHPETPSPNTYAGEFLWTAANNQFGWRSMLGPGTRAYGAECPVSPYVSPARAKDLAGLPATYLSVGAIDLFVDEIIDYGQRLIRAGVPTEMHIVPGAFHGFDLLPDTAIKARFQQSFCEALHRALQPERSHHPCEGFADPSTGGR